MFVLFFFHGFFYLRGKNIFSFSQACKQLEALGHFEDAKVTSQVLREAMALAQHHDALTGTEKQHVVYDYAKRLSIGVDQCKVRYTL